MPPPHPRKPRHTKTKFFKGLLRRTFWDAIHSHRPCSQVHAELIIQGLLQMRASEYRMQCVRSQGEHGNTGGLESRGGKRGPKVMREGPGLQLCWPPPPQPLLTTVWLGRRGGGRDSTVVSESGRAHCRQGTRLREMLIIC